MFVGPWTLTLLLPYHMVAKIKCTSILLAKAVQEGKCMWYQICIIFGNKIKVFVLLWLIIVSANDKIVIVWFCDHELELLKYLSYNNESNVVWFFFIFRILYWEKLSTSEAFYIWPSKVSCFWVISFLFIARYHFGVEGC